MIKWVRAGALSAIAAAAVLLMPSSAAAQVRVGVFVGAPIVAGPVVVAPAPRVFAPAVPYYYPYGPYAYAPYYSPYWYAGGYPYWGGYYGFRVSAGRRYAPRAFYRGRVGRRRR